MLFYMSPICGGILRLHVFFSLTKMCEVWLQKELKMQKNGFERSLLCGVDKRGTPFYPKILIRNMHISFRYVHMK